MLIIMILTARIAQPTIAATDSGGAVKYLMFLFVSMVILQIRFM